MFLFETLGCLPYENEYMLQGGAHVPEKRRSQLEDGSQGSSPPGAPGDSELRIPAMSQSQGNPATGDGLLSKLSGENTSTVADSVAKFQEKAASLTGNSPTQTRSKAKPKSKVMKVATKKKKAGSGSPPKKTTIQKVGDKKVEKTTIQKKPAATFDNLSFDRKKSFPLYYGPVTVYHNTIGDEWRVKPAPGRRDEKKFKYKSCGIRWGAQAFYVEVLRDPSDPERICNR